MLQAYPSEKETKNIIKNEKQILNFTNSNNMLTGSVLLATKPSGVQEGAGNVSQSTSSHESRDQSADHTLTRLSVLTASHNWEPAGSAERLCAQKTCSHNNISEKHQYSIVSGWLIGIQ